MKEVKYYYDGLLRLIAKKLNLKDFESLTHEEIKNSANVIDESIISLFEKFKISYDEFNNYFENTYKDKPFTIEETEEYNNLSSKMNSIRDELLKKVNK